MSDPRPVTPDPEAISSFLKIIGGDLHLCSIVPDGDRCKGKWFGDDAEAATTWAMTENEHGKGVYWTVNCVIPGRNKKATKGEIRAARFLHVDVDPPKGLPCLDKVRAEAELRALPCPPTMIIDSGGGLQAFWRLDGPPDPAAAEALYRHAAPRLGGDHCHSIEHLMRLPGTVNYPNARKRENGREPSVAKVIHVQ